MNDVSGNRRVQIALRVTAAVAAIQGVGHAALFLTARPKHGPSEVAVIEAMRAQSFNFGGFEPHSYWDMYFGYGLLAVVFALFISAIIWLISDLASEPRRVRRIAAVIGFAVTVHAIIIARYFFMLPLAFDVLVIAGLAVSVLLSLRASARAG